MEAEEEVFPDNLQQQIQQGSDVALHHCLGLLPKAYRAPIQRALQAKPKSQLNVPALIGVADHRSK